MQIRGVLIVPYKKKLILDHFFLYKVITKVDESFLDFPVLHPYLIDKKRRVYYQLPLQVGFYER